MSAPAGFEYLDEIVDEWSTCRKCDGPIGFVPEHVMGLAAWYHACITPDMHVGVPAAAQVAPVPLTEER